MNQITPMWTLRETILELKALEAELQKINFHCWLTGSILYRGESFKDLDVIIYPRHKSEVGEGSNVDWEVAKAFLTKWFEAEGIKDCSSISQDRDDKQVAWLRTKSGKRIDFFFLM